MWYLEIFDQKSRELVRDFAMPEITDTILRTLINIDETLYPMGAGAHPVTIEELPNLSPFVDGEIPVNNSYNYYASLFRD